MTRSRRDGGQVAIYLVVLMTIVVFLIGLVVDGGAVIRARNEAFGLAAGAARAGAQQLDEDARAEGRVELSTTRAADAAQRYLSGHDVTGTVEVSPGEITVTVERTVPYVFIGPGERTVEATSTVEPTQGPTP